MNYQRMMHRIMLESYTLPSRRSCSGIFTQHHSTKIPENTQGVWAHKNEQLNDNSTTAIHWNRWSLRFRYMWFSVQIQQIECMNQPFDECHHGCPGVFMTRVHGSCSCRFWILISLAVLLLNLTLRDVHADCEQSLIFLCKATPRVNHARERRFP